MTKIKPGYILLPSSIKNFLYGMFKILSDSAGKESIILQYCMTFFEEHRGMWVTRKLQQHLLGDGMGEVTRRLLVTYTWSSKPLIFPFINFFRHMNHQNNVCLCVKNKYLYEFDKPNAILTGSSGLEYLILRADKLIWNNLSIKQTCSSSEIHYDDHPL